MLALPKKLLRNTHGQDLAEYAIALAVIALGAGVAAVALAGDLATLWSTAASVIAAVAA